MTQYALDTDTLTLWLRGHESVRREVAMRDPSELATTIITVEEIMSGWYAQVRRARNDDQMARAYSALQQAVEVAGQIELLAFDASAIRRFRDLRRLRPRAGINDLKIAAIVLEHGATLVTRNVQDFQNIPGLRIENWA